MDKNEVEFLMGLVMEKRIYLNSLTHKVKVDNRTILKKAMLDAEYFYYKKWLENYEEPVMKKEKEFL